MVNITITYSECSTDMMRTAEYEGRKNGTYDTLRAVKNDKNQLLQFWQDGVTELNNILDKVIVKFGVVSGDEAEDNICDRDLQPGINIIEDDVAEDIDQTAVFTLNVNNDGLPILRKTMQRFVVSMMLAMWFRIVSPETFAKYENDEALCRKQLTELAYYREMP